jgi:hypothetical protein
LPSGDFPVWKQPNENGTYLSQKQKVTTTEACQTASTQLGLNTAGPLDGAFIFDQHYVKIYLLAVAALAVGMRFGQSASFTCSWQ